MTVLKPKKIYLAIPYTGIEKESHRIANEVMAKLCKEGYLVFSPISMCHLASEHHGLPGDITFWMELDSAFVEWCDAVMVIDLGEDEFDKLNSGGKINYHHYGKRLILASKGVQFEIALAKQLRKQILYHIYEPAA